MGTPLIFGKSSFINEFSKSLVVNGFLKDFLKKQPYVDFRGFAIGFYLQIFLSPYFILLAGSNLCINFQPVLYSFGLKILKSV